MALSSNNHAYQRHQQLFSIRRDFYQQHQQHHQQHRAIAPRPHNTASHSPNAGTALDSNHPAVIRRNARERNRVKQVNNGFSNLRQHLPPAIVADLSNGRRGIGPGAHKKLSKVDTLRMAVEYIRRLQRVIDDEDTKHGSAACSSSSEMPFYSGVSYAGSFARAQSQSQNSLQSPNNSIGSCASEHSVDSSSSWYGSPACESAQGRYSSVQMKFERDTEQHCQNEQDDILDFITWWQEEV